MPHVVVKRPVMARTVTGPGDEMIAHENLGSSAPEQWLRGKGCLIAGPVLDVPWLAAVSAVMTKISVARAGRVRPYAGSSE